MKKRNSILLVLSILLLLTVANNKIAGKTSEPSYKIASTHADYVVFEDLKELEEHADLIIKAKFSGDRELKNWYINDEIVETAAKSFVKVNKVYKGTLDEKIISIYEPAYLTEDTFVNIEGYNLLNEEGNYILFLRKNLVDETYVIVGMYQGKYNLNIDPAKKYQASKNKSIEKSILESYDYLGEEDQFYVLKQQVHKKYND